MDTSASAPGYYYVCGRRSSRRLKARIVNGRRAQLDRPILTESRVSRDDRDLQYHVVTLYLTLAVGRLLAVAQQNTLASRYTGHSFM